MDRKMDLKKKREDLERTKKQLESAFQQVLGQLTLLDELEKKEEEGENKEKK